LADATADDAVRFAVKAVRGRAQVSGLDIASVRAAGFTDSQIVEMIAVVAENGFTNRQCISAGNLVGDDRAAFLEGENAALRARLAAHDVGPRGVA
jgi:hypothetical protein